MEFVPSGRKLVNFATLNALVLIFLLMLGYLALELYLRIFGLWGPNVYPLAYLRDLETGWALNRNLNLQFEQTDAAGAHFPVIFTTNKAGFLATGDISSNRPKVLFLGDSFTADPNVSNSDAYYSVVKDHLGIEVFATGAGGFGTLQELILLERYYHVIKPDLIVLQFCSNDFENNSIELEARTVNRHQRFYRPYYVKGQRIFLQGYASLYRFFVERSRAFSYLDWRLFLLQQGIFKPVVPSDALDRAEQITKDLLNQIKTTAKKTTKFATFNCLTTSSELTKRWERAARAAKFEVWPDISLSVESAGRQGAVVRMADGSHWNRLGHKIAGEALAERIRRLLPVSAARKVESLAVAGRLGRLEAGKNR